MPLKKQSKRKSFHAETVRTTMIFWWFGKYVAIQRWVQFLVDEHGDMVFARADCSDRRLKERAVANQSHQG